MKKITIAILLCGVLISGFSQSGSKTDNIKTLLELTGTGKLGVQVAQTMITNFKKNYPDVPDDFWNEFSKEMHSDTLIKMLIPIYGKYYSGDEIKQLTAFYQSPIGKRVVEITPQLMQESMQVGQTWGKEIGEKVVNTLQQKGYLKKEQ